MKCSQTLSVLSLSVLMTLPAIAHTIEVSGDVAATFHLEPNHNPKAGETAQAWFALTQKGGRSIPLTQCECVLSVYAKPRTPTAQPLFRPTLRATSAEKYRNIPGAEITFPRVGAYELQLQGKPQNGATFKPFQLSYTVNVGS